MIVKSIELVNFRNYRSLVVYPGSSINVFFGNNGQGKTNLVESIYMGACARSHRTSRDVDLIFKNENQYSLTLQFVSSYQSHKNEDFVESVGINYKQSQTVGNNKNKRILRKDGMEITKTSDFVGHFHAVIFAPEDLQLIKDGPIVRRRFLDILLSQINPSYFKNLQDYSHILRQRNALLKILKEKQQSESLTDFDISQLEIWDEQLALRASQVIRKRYDLLDRLSYNANVFHKKISGNREEISFKYRTIPNIQVESTVGEIKEIIFNRLKRQHSDDIFRGNTSTGPHRDDFDIYINNEEMKVFASQGQQRTAVLAMKMAELEIIKHVTQETPVLILDDVMSELDGNRRKQLVSSLMNTQIFITCTDPEQLDKDWLKDIANEDIKYFYVSEGSIQPVTSHMNGEDMV